MTGPSATRLHDADYDDTVRDALALYRAMLDQDRDAAMAVIAATTCEACLAALAVQIGLWLAAGDEDIAPCGRFAERYAEWVRDTLVLLQPEGPVPGAPDGDPS